MLPSGYTPMTAYYAWSGGYIDIGIAPKSTMSVECSFITDKPLSSQSSTPTGYIFGARNSNSNTSAGQLNLFIGLSGQADYVGWQSARLSQTISSSDAVPSGCVRCNLSSDLNVFKLAIKNQFVGDFTGSTNTFTGTQNIHIPGLNNGGSHTSQGHLVWIKGFNLYDDNVLVRHLLPAYEDSTGQAGMYDTVNNVFYGDENSDVGFLLQTESSSGGNAYIRTENFGGISKQRFIYYDTAFYDPITVVADAQLGYDFSHWEINGSKVSNDFEYTFVPTADTTIKAVFTKKVKQAKNNYRAMCINYGTGNGVRNMRDRSFFTVISFDIKMDVLQKMTSTLVCKDIPSTVQNNIPLFLYSPKGRIIYYGLVTSIKENTITCREPLAIMDEDQLLPTSYYNAHYTVAEPLRRFMVNSANNFVSREKSVFDVVEISPYMTLNSDYVCNETMESIDSNEVVNGEDYIIEFFKNYGITMRYKLLVSGSGNYIIYKMQIEPFIPQGVYETLVLGDNLETIKDLTVTIEEAESTILTIYNSTGTTIRGYYGIDVNGAIKKYVSGTSDESQFLAYNNCKHKIILSDEPLDTLAKQNLNSSFYNHKITFTVYFDNKVKFEQLHLGQNVDFYVGNKLYQSVLTAIDYSVGENDDEIYSAKCTLGIVRNNLTSKLNLGKVR